MSFIPRDIYPDSTRSSRDKIFNVFSPMLFATFTLFIVGRGVPDFSDEEEDFSSGNDDGEGEGSDSEPMIDERRRGRNNKMNGNVRVSLD